MKEILECRKIADYSAPIDFINRLNSLQIKTSLPNDSLGDYTRVMYFEIPLEAEYLKSFIIDIPEEFVSLRDEAHTQTINMMNVIFSNYTMVRGSLMSLRGNADQNKHQDPRVFHRFCNRVHWPLITNPSAKLCIGENSYHLPEGTLWAFDNISTLHHSKNEGNDIRFHIVIDVLPTDRLEFILKHISGRDFYSAWRNWPKRKDRELMKVLGIEEENSLPDFRTEFIKNI